MVQRKGLISLFAAVYCCQHYFSLVYSFGYSSTRTSTRTKGLAALPRDVKEAVSTCRTSVQEALKQRISRMDIEFPVGTDFGIEKKDKKKIKSNGGTVVSKEILDCSDRELCRLFVEMFQPLGGQHIAAVFVDEALAREAKAQWAGESSAGCKILSMGRRKQDHNSKEKKKRGMGFASKLSAELESVSGGTFQLPEKCEVALFVSPGPKEFVIIERICSNAGLGTLVILLNARLGNVEKFSSAAADELFRNEFVPIFNLAAAPQEVAPNCLLYHAFPTKDWVLARKPKAGPPKIIASQQDRFSVDDCKRAYDNIEVEKVEGIVEGFMTNVANWLG
jgi:hypothetical protein